ncbi:MAG: response regulator transcription factor [Arcobacter sp.]|nr:response regulator transcription factor [Arcobacter sp.]
MIRILMIEDDLEIAELLSEYLFSFGMEISNYDSPILGISALNIVSYDLIILDLSLPELDGIEVCKAIRKKSEIPIIISSARNDIEDKAICFNMGADDYLPKPYNPQELVLRINSLLKRNKVSVNNLPAKQKVFITKPEKMEIWQNNQLLHLTNAEFHIMEYLIKKYGLVVSREEILVGVESIKYESSYKSIDVLIGRLRAKIEENPKQPKHIVSIRGIGYKLKDE